MLNDQIKAILHSALTWFDIQTNSSKLTDEKNIYVVIFRPVVIGLQCEHMCQNTSVHVKAVIYNANTQTPNPETHIHHFSTPYTGLPQRQCGVNTEICHLSLHQ